MTEEELAKSPVIRMAGSDGETYETTADRASEMAYAAQAEGVALKPFVKTKDAEGNVHEISPFDGAALKEAQDRGDERWFASGGADASGQENYFSAEALKAGAARFAIGLVNPWDWLRGIGTVATTVARGFVKGTVGTAMRALQGATYLGESYGNAMTGTDDHTLSEGIGKVNDVFEGAVDAVTPDLFELTGEYDGIAGAKEATGAVRGVAEMVANVKGIGKLTKLMQSSGASARAAHAMTGAMFGAGKYGDVASDPNGPGGWRQQAAAIASGTADAVIFGLWNPFKISAKYAAELKPFAEATRREVTKRVLVRLGQALESGASMATVEAVKQGAEQLAGGGLRGAEPANQDGEPANQDGSTKTWGERTLAESAKEVGAQFLVGSAFAALDVAEANIGRFSYNRARKAQGADLSEGMKVAMSYQVERNRKDICPKYHEQAVYAYNMFVKQGGRSQSFRDGFSMGPDVRRINEDGSVVFDDGSVWRADPRMKGGATITVSDGTILSETGELLGYRARQESGGLRGTEAANQDRGPANQDPSSPKTEGKPEISERAAAPRAENAMVLLQQMDEGALPVVELAIGDIEGRAPTENGNEIAEYDAAKAKPIVVLEDYEGNYHAMTGGKRLLMAGASGAETIKAVVVREADGWTADMAEGLNATENLRGGNATMKNVVAAVDTIGADKVAEIAGWHQANGSREMASKIRQGLAIAQKSGTELRAALEAGSVSEEFAYNAAQVLSMERVGEGWQEAQKAVAELAGMVGPEELDAVLWGLKGRITRGGARESGQGAGESGRGIDWDAAIAEERAKYNAKKGGTEGQLDSDQVLIETGEGELKTLGEVEAESGSASAKGSGATSGENDLTQRRGEAESAETSVIARADIGKVREAGVSEATKQEFASDTETAKWNVETEPEVVRRIEPQKLNNAEPVTPEKGNNIVRRAIKKLFAAFGKVKNQADGREVVFNGKDAGKMMMQSGVDMRTFAPELKNLFETALPAWSDPPMSMEGHKDHPDVLDYRHYVNKFVGADGKDYYIRFTVREQKGTDGRKGVHAATVSEVAIYEDANAAKTVLGNNPGESAASSLVTTGSSVRANELRGHSHVFTDDRLAKFLGKGKGVKLGGSAAPIGDPEAEPLYAAAEGAAANKAVELKPVDGKDGTFMTLSHPEARFTVDGERRTLAVDGLTAEDFEPDRIERTAALVAKVEAYAADNLLKIGFYDDGVAQLWKTVKGNIAAEGKAAYEAASLEAKRKTLVEQLAKSGLADGGVVETAEDFERLFQELSGEALRKGEEVYGFVDPKTKKVYLNPEFFATGQGIEAPIHEFGHLGVIAAEKINKPVYDRGMKLAKELLEGGLRGAEPANQDPPSPEATEGKPANQDGGVRGLVDFILNDRVYSGQSRKVQAEELLAQLIGKRGEEALRAETDKSVVAKIKSWLVEFWNTFGKALGLKDITPEQAAKMTLEDVADAIRAEMLSGRKYGEGFAGVEFANGGAKVRTKPARIRRKRTGRVKAVDEFVSRMGGAEDPANTETDLLGLWVDNGGRLFDALPFEIETGYSKGASGMKVRRGSVADEFAESTAFYKGLNPAQRAVYFGTGKLEYGSIGEGLKAKLADAGITRFTNEDGTVDYEAVIGEFERQWTNYERGEKFLEERRAAEEEHDRAIVEQMEREEAAEREANDETSAAESSARAEAEAAGVMFSRGEIQQRTEDAKAKSQAMDETLGRLSQIQRDFAAEKAKTGIGIGEYYKRVNAALGANYVFDLGKPYGRIARFIPDGNLQLKLKTLMRKMKEQYKSDHPFTFDETKNLVENVNNPPIIMRRDEATAGAKVFFEAPGGRIFCASINPKGNINDIETLFPKDVERLVKTIARSKGKSKDILDVDTSKAVEMLTRWSNTTLGEHSNDLEDAVSILKNFAAVNGRPRILMSRSGIFTGSAADYANRSRLKGINTNGRSPNAFDTHTGLSGQTSISIANLIEKAKGLTPVFTKDVYAHFNENRPESGYEGLLYSRGGRAPEAEYVKLTRVADDAGVGEQTPGALAASRELSRQAPVPLTAKGTRYVSLPMSEMNALARYLTGHALPAEMGGITRGGARESGQGARESGRASLKHRKLWIAADVVGSIDKTDLAAEKAMLKQHGFFANEDVSWVATHSPAEVRKERERSEEALSSRLEKLADRRTKGTEAGGMAAGRRVFADQLAKVVMSMPHGQPGVLGAMQTVGGALEKRVRGSDAEAESFLDWMEGGPSQVARSAQGRKAGMFAAFLMMPKEMEARAKGWYDAMRSTIAGDAKLSDAFRKMTSRMMSEQGYAHLEGELRRTIDEQYEANVKKLRREADEPIKAGGLADQAAEKIVLSMDDRGGAAMVRVDAKLRIYQAAQKELMKQAKTPSEKAQIKQQTDLFIGEVAQAKNQAELARTALERGRDNEGLRYFWRMVDLINEATVRDGLKLQDISLYLDQQRVIETKGLSGSRGQSARQAQLVLDAMSRRLGGDFAKVEAFARRFHAIHEQELLNDPLLEKILGKGTAEYWRSQAHYVTTKRTFSPEELAEIEAARRALAASGAAGGDNVVGQMFNYIGRPSATGKLKGSFADKQEVISATFEKVAEVQKFLKRSAYVIELRDLLQKAGVEGVHDFAAGKSEFKKNQRYGAISYMENGQKRTLVVPREIADGFDRQMAYDKGVLKMCATVNGLARQLWIDFNPVYWQRNIARNAGSMEMNMPGMREAAIKRGLRFVFPGLAPTTEIALTHLVRHMPEKMSLPLRKIWGEHTALYYAPQAKRMAMWLTDHNEMQRKLWEAKKRGDLETVRQMEEDKRLMLDALKGNMLVGMGAGKASGTTGFLDDSVRMLGKTMQREMQERAANPKWKRALSAINIFEKNAKQQVFEDVMAKFSAYLHDRVQFGKTHNRTAAESGLMVKKNVSIGEGERRGEAAGWTQALFQPFWNMVEKGVVRNVKAYRDRPAETFQKAAWRIAPMILHGLIGSGAIAAWILRKNDGDEERVKAGPLGEVYGYLRAAQRAYQNCSNYVRENYHVTPLMTDGYTSVIIGMPLTDEERLLKPIARFVTDVASVAAGTKEGLEVAQALRDATLGVVAPDFTLAGALPTLLDDTVHAMWENPEDYYTGGKKYDNDVWALRNESWEMRGKFIAAMGKRLWNDFGGRNVLPVDRAGVDNGLGRAPGWVARMVNDIPVASPILRSFIKVQVGSPKRDAAEITEAEARRRAVCRVCAKELFETAHKAKGDISIDQAKYNVQLQKWKERYDLTDDELADIEGRYLNAWRSYEGAQYRADGEREKYRAKAERLGMDAANIWLDFD